eukprot:509792-Prymnesium_polylepis.2
MEKTPGRDLPPPRWGSAPSCCAGSCASAVLQCRQAKGLEGAAEGQVPVEVGVLIVLRHSCRFGYCVIIS